MLENLQPAPKIDAPVGWKPAVEFNGSEGEATTNGYGVEDKPNFDQFLLEAGFDPAEIEIVGEPRTSRWQRYDGAWLTAYRFRFRKITSVIDLPLLYSQAKRTKYTKPKTALNDKALVVLWSDLQVGKVASRGGVAELIERVLEKTEALIAFAKREKISRVVFCDVGDTIENFGNAANLAQLQSNDLSLMAQVDLATTLAWETLKQLSKLAPEVTYASVGSNHCQWRVSKQRVGTPTDDWAIHIGRTLARLSNEVGLGIKFLEPHRDDESLIVDVFGDNFHRLGLAHGHQANRPEGVPNWWKAQAFGNQPVAAATILASGHFHHLRVQEIASTERGSSRFWVQAATLDNGSDWYRLTSGEDSAPGLVCFVLEKNVEFTGTVVKL
jgi:hypothetical protein